MKVYEIINLFKSKKRRDLEKQLEKTRDALDNLNGAIEDAIWWLGFDSYLRDLIAYIDTSDEPILRPRKMMRSDSKRLDCLIWVLLVLQYGTFDDSPVNGTITDKQSALAHLHTWREVSEGNV